MEAKRTSFNILLFDEYEAMDAFGPAEIIGHMSARYSLNYYSLNGGIITSTQNLGSVTYPVEEMDTTGVLLIPGGVGTRRIVQDACAIRSIADLAGHAEYVLTVCTGSAVLAMTGMLDGRRATSNKIVLDWVRNLRDQVLWQKTARWTVDGKYYTSSGVTAGMDMTLGFLRDIHGPGVARSAANFIEYVWNDDMSFDPFALE